MKTQGRKWRWQIVGDNVIWDDRSRRRIGYRKRMKK